MPSEVEQLSEILRKNRSLSGKVFSDAETDLLTRHYQLVLKWNHRLHLTTLTQPEDFYQRHIQESAFSESLILPTVNRVWDLGSGLGAPGMVIAILRPDLELHLVEASRNKAVFLEEASADLNLKNVTVLRSRFEAIQTIPANSCLTVRAIEGMERKISDIIKSGKEASQILILGALGLEETAREYLRDDQRVESLLIPNSKFRYVINIFCST